MPDAFLALSRTDRLEALGVVAQTSGRPMHLLEKDVWVVWALEVLFTSDFRESLVFKGGTSLSKAYQVVRRFSEDVDVTYDIRSLAPDLIAGSTEALPPNRSQEKRWSKVIRERLPEWIGANIVPAFESAISGHNLHAKVEADVDKVLVSYESISVGSGYVAPVVLVEFGARSTGEPWELKPLVCDAAAFLPELEFPSASPRVMRPERTFWEKATAIHAFCAQGAFRGGHRFARHWHDVVRLAQSGYLESALNNRQLRESVARHKAMFFPEKREDGSAINYAAGVSGQLQLVPTEANALRVLAEDYQHMVEDGLFAGDVESWEELMNSCQAIQERVNRASEAAGQ